jgi:hypothetical protein
MGFIIRLIRFVLWGGKLKRFHYTGGGYDS